MSGETIITSRYFSVEGELLLRALLSILRSKISTVYSYESNLNINECSIFIIDIDDERGHHLWQQHFDEKKPFMVAYTQDSEKIPERYLFLKKPLRSDNLKQVLEKIFNPVSPDNIAVNVTTENKNLKSKADVQKITTDNAFKINPFKNCLLDLIIKNNSIPLLIKNKTPIIIEAGKLRYYGISSDFDMENLLLTSHHLLPIEEIPSHQMTEYANNMMSSELSTPLWKTILTHSKGILLCDLHDSDFFKLKRWPNLNKLYHNSKHTKLSVYLSKYGSDIKTLSSLTGIPASDIVNFINACYALHYLEVTVAPDKATPDRISSYKSISNGRQLTQKSSLFSKIRNRLGI